MAPEEDRNPVTVELEDFFLCCKDPANHKPKSNLEVGLNDSTAVILSNLAMDEHRRVDFSEMQTLGLGERRRRRKQPGSHVGWAAAHVYCSNPTYRP